MLPPVECCRCRKRALYQPLMGGDPIASFFFASEFPKIADVAISVPVRHEDQSRVAMPIAALAGSLDKRFHLRSQFAIAGAPGPYPKSWLHDEGRSIGNVCRING
jgi:hypothetical protein